MIKITIAFIATLLVLNTNAQIKKGNTLLGGQIAANSSKFNSVIQYVPTPNPYPINAQSISSKASLIGINIGTAFKENKVIGLNFSTNTQKQTDYYPFYDTSSSKTNQYEIGIFYRQYKKLAKDFYFFGQVDLATLVGNGTRTYNRSSYNITAKQTGGKLSISTGISYAVLKKLQVELTLPSLLGLQFTNTKQTSTDPNTRTDDNKQFSFNSALSTNNAIGNLGIGFRLVL
jgi:hypothetical protein